MTARNVFLSHTSRMARLPKGRSFVQAALDALAEADLLPRDMRFFTADDRTPAEVCIEAVRRCDVYVGIFGLDYGSPVRDRPEVSYTGLEFETALERKRTHGMRVFAFLLDEKVTNDGLGPLDPRQEAVRKRVLDSGLTASRFANPDELQHLLYRTLMERLTTPRGVVPSVERSPGEVTTIDLGSGVEMKFAWCPPGTFPMGSPAGEPQREDDETQHQVTLTRGYWLGIHLVTQAQWQAVMGSSPGQFRGDTFPVERVSWEDCQEFIKRLAQKTGRRFRLPTEAEWEYACRAGTDTPFHFGKTISTDQANYDGRHTHGKCEKGVFQERTTPVAHFPANAWGLYDMHGNLWEWCQDRYWPYPSAEIIDPQGDNDGTARVVRGGTWYDGPWLCRSAYRGRAEPGRRFDLFGCRVLLCQD